MDWKHPVRTQVGARCFICSPMPPVAPLPADIIPHRTATPANHRRRPATETSREPLAAPQLGRPLPAARGGATSGYGLHVCQGGLLRPWAETRPSRPSTGAQPCRPLKDGEPVIWRSNSILQYAAGFAGETDNVHKLTGLLVTRLGMQPQRRPGIVTNGLSCRSPVT